MDDFSKQLGWGHRLLRHNADMIQTAGELYGKEGGREASLHIACDMGLITIGDLVNTKKKEEETRPKKSATGFPIESPHSC